ncbi:MAG: hypothetical protein LDLANPLL_01763 [Turneriella sp.]|nr:hypothetical protein [Turneriella sp.]
MYKKLYVAIIIFILIPIRTDALSAVASRLNCEAHFFEAYFDFPKNYDKNKDMWLMSMSMHRIFKEPPLSSYTFFRKMETHIWKIKILKPIREEFPFLKRYELTFLESRVTSLGEVFYRFEQKIAGRGSVRFTAEVRKPTIIFLEHRGEFDMFLHLTCVPI